MKPYFSLLYLIFFPLLTQAIAPDNFYTTLVFNPPSDEWLRANCRKFGYKCAEQFVSYDRGLVGKRFPSEFSRERDVTERINVGGMDGHCGFRALSLALTGTEANYKAIKADLLNYLERMLEDKTISTEDTQKIREGIAITRKPGAPFNWVNNLAAARLYQLNILSCVQSNDRTFHRWELSNPIEKTVNWFHREQLSDEYPSVYCLNRDVHAQVITNPWPGAGRKLRSPDFNHRPLGASPSSFPHLPGGGLLESLQNQFHSGGQQRSAIEHQSTKHPRRHNNRSRKGQQGEEREQFPPSPLLFYVVVFILLFILFTGH